MVIKEGTWFHSLQFFDNISAAIVSGGAVTSDIMQNQQLFEEINQSITKKFKKRVK